MGNCIATPLPPQYDINQLAALGAAKQPGRFDSQFCAHVAKAATGSKTSTSVSLEQISAYKAKMYPAFEKAVDCQREAAAKRGAAFFVVDGGEDGHYFVESEVACGAMLSAIRAGEIESF